MGYIGTPIFRRPKEVKKDASHTVTVAHFLVLLLSTQTWPSAVLVCDGSNDTRQGLRNAHSGRSGSLALEASLARNMRRIQEAIVAAKARVASHRYTRGNLSWPSSEPLRGLSSWDMFATTTRKPFPQELLVFSPRTGRAPTPKPLNLVEPAGLVVAGFFSRSSACDLRVASGLRSLVSLICSRSFNELEHVSQELQSVASS